MSKAENGNFTSLVSRTGKGRKIFYFNRKSCIAMALSAALLFTSVDCMSVRAEELADRIPPVSGEGSSPYLTNEKGAVIISSFKELSEGETRIKFVGEKQELEKVLALMPKELTANVTLAPSVSENTPGNDTAPGEGDQPGEGDTTPGEGDQPGEGNTTPGEGDQPGEGDTTPGEGDQPGEGDTAPGEGDQPGEGDTAPGEGDQPSEGDTTPGEGDQPGGGDAEPGAGDQPGAGGNDDQGGADTGNGDNGGADDGSNGDTGSSSDVEEDSQSSGSEEGESLSVPDAANDVASVVMSETFMQDGQRWHFLVETGESSGDDHNGGTAGGSGGSYSGDGAEDGNGGSEGDEGSAEDGNGGNEGGSSGGTEDGSGGSEDGEGSAEDGAGGSEGGEGSAGDGTGESEDGGIGGNEDGATGDNTDDTESGEDTENPEIVPPVSSDFSRTVEVKVPVTWNCDTYEEEASSYIFVPEWEETDWFFEESEEHKIPTIEVVYVEPGSEVSTEAELAAAFAAGIRRITLQKDISLTKPLELPATAKIELDGQGYSILRGKTEAADGGAGDEFTGVMIRMDGEDYSEDTYGRLTLKNIAVDGTTQADHAGAPAILDNGELILETGAVVKENDNYGTQPEGDDEGAKKILPYGGGIQVYGKLTVMEGSSITKNYAAERGGGVYLFSGSTLYLYADVIKENSVGSVDGKEYGADLYAEEGSRIYFDPSIDMEQLGFYICEGVIEGPQRPPTDPSRKELFIYVNEDSGYSSVQIAELKDALREMGYKVLEVRTDIDTTDMRNWYVYDHYDENLWKSQKNWEKAYGKASKKRGYYPYKSVVTSYYPNGYYHFPTDANSIVTIIEDWLNSPAYGMSYKELAQFEEHIWVRAEEERSMMTFVGYGENPHVDFMYYDPESDGEKVVDFDVDSSIIDTHTLTGNGFLVNTGTDDSGNMSGYLILYHYPTRGRADTLTLYQMRLGATADLLHEGPLNSAAQAVMTVNVGSEWQTKMSVQIRIRPNKIEVRQQPQSKGTDISKTTPILEYTIPDSGYSGFGPLVAYGSHGCPSASTFTYSDLRMYYTNPQLEGGNMLSPVDLADFTQDGMQKYFIDLFGSANLNFSPTMNMGEQYHEYMKMMQTEGIALITDRETPFAPYLGKANGSESNLFELGLGEGGELPGPKELAERIHNSISTKSTTDLQEKVEDGKLTEASPRQSVGNIWLQSAETGEQIRETLYGNTFSDDGYEIQVVDDEDITYYHGKQSVTYEILKPKAKKYVSLGKGTASSGFKITVPKDKSAWPAGLYTVRQKINKSGIYGYAYFTLEWRDPPIPAYNVTLTVRKNGEEWTGHGKDFMLQPATGGSLIKLSEPVVAGTYSVIELVREGSLIENINTGVSVEVKNVDKTVEVDYYTVTFYDGLPSPDKKPEAYGNDTGQKQQIVLKNGHADSPPAPTGEQRTFAEWVTAEGEVFDFVSETITAAKEIYATWTYPVAVEVMARKEGEEWNDHGKRFMLRPEGSDDLIDISENVPPGTYVVYDVTGLIEGDSPTEDMNTGASVKVTAEDGKTAGTVKKVLLDYYTVTFYDGPEGEEPKAYGSDTDQRQQFVLKDMGRVTRPQTDPTKEGYTFDKWMAEGADEKFDFDRTPITASTNIYASWIKNIEPTYKVTIKVKKDGYEWNDHKRVFALREDGGTRFITDLDQVENGIYSIYDMTGINPDFYWSRAVDTGENVEVTGGDTDVDVTVKGADAEAEINYYTVTFYDGKTAYGMDTPQKPVVILNGRRAAEPEAPDKAGYFFAGWKTEDGGSTPYDFTQGIRRKTDIYAGWTPVPVYTITATAGKGGQISPAGAVSVNEGKEQSFTITPNKGYHIKAVKVDETDVTDSITGKDNSYTFTDVRENHTISASFEADKKPDIDKKSKSTSHDDGGGEDTQTVTVWQEAEPQAADIQETDTPAPGGKEPKTGDTTPVEIYATVAMVAGLTYLLLYFLDESRGMTEREKEVFVAAFIRWAKKGGRFRKCCAMVAIFCILVYYHSIGKRTSRNQLNREYLRHVL